VDKGLAGIAYFLCHDRLLRGVVARRRRAGVAEMAGD
jgi:hypothetical protein